MELTPVMKKFVLHWGEMGTRWGINRTVAQCHALLYLAPRPIHAEEITEALGVARSNVSTSLRELQGWGIVRVVHVLGDRRDHFEALSDVWELFQTILDERKRREIDPTLAILRECAAEAKSAGRKEKHVRERIGNLLDFFETMAGWYDGIRSLSKASLRQFVRLGRRLPGLLG